jgi:hypothetical protein
MKPLTLLILLGLVSSLMAAEVTSDYKLAVAHKILADHPKFTAIIGIQFSFPGYVFVGPKSEGAKRKLCKAVTFTYSNWHGPNGTVAFPMARGYALLTGGDTVTITGLDDPNIEWAHGQPAPDPETFTCSPTLFDITHLSKIQDLPDATTPRLSR